MLADFDRGATELLGLPPDRYIERHGMGRFWQQLARAPVPGTRIITCMAVDKRNHAQQGDVLVDDTLKHRHLWEEAGGIFIHHRNVDQTLRELAAYFPLNEAAVANQVG